MKHFLTTFQEPACLIAWHIQKFHDRIFVQLILISVFIFIILLFITLNFRFKTSLSRGHQTGFKFGIFHNQTLEIVWTISSYFNSFEYLHPKFLFAFTLWI